MASAVSGRNASKVALLGALFGIGLGAVVHRYQSKFRVRATASTSASASASDAGYRPLLCSSAPGKIILCGEHAVVHGARAVATTVEKRTYAFVDVPTAASGESASKELVIDLEFQRRPQRHVFAVETLRRIASEHYANAPASPVVANEKEAEETPQTVAAVCKALSARVDTAFPDYFDAKTREKARGGATASGDEEELLVSLKVILVLYILSVRAGVPLRLRIRSELPMRAGLGSSASFSAAVSAAFYRLKYTTATGTAASPSTAVSSSVASDGTVALSAGDRGCINRWAYGAEVLLHGTPSGVDNTCIVYGGVIVFRKDVHTGAQSITLMNKLPSLRLLVTNTRVDRSTKALVARVRELIAIYNTRASLSTAVSESEFLTTGAAQQLSGSIRSGVIDLVLSYVSFTNAPAIIDRLDTISGALISCIERIQANGNESKTDAGTDSVTALYHSVCSHFPEVQSHLAAVEVSHASIESVIAHARMHGFGDATKLTGAGGGGCVITVVPPPNTTFAGDADVAGFIASQRAAGRDCFDATIGQAGVVVYDGKGINDFTLDLA